VIGLQKQVALAGSIRQVDTRIRQTVAFRSKNKYIEMHINEAVSHMRQKGEVNKYIYIYI